MPFRAQWGLIPFDPFGAVLHVHYLQSSYQILRYISVLLSDDVRFFNMGAEWGGYPLHLFFFESLLYPRFVLLWCLSLFSWVTPNSHRCLRKGLVWWDIPILYAQCLLFLVDVVVTLMMFPLVTMLQKGSTSFGAAHLQFCSAWFVTFLPLLLSLVPTKLLPIFIWISLQLIMPWSEIILPIENKTRFLRFCFKMSWYKITKTVRVVNEGTSRTSAGTKKIDASRNRLFRIAIMSCACLLMNTAATISLSMVLEDWSVSSDKWLTCTVGETPLTRNWANYGFHAGDRYFLFGSAAAYTCWLLFWLLLRHLLY